MLDRRQSNAGDLETGGVLPVMYDQTYTTALNIGDEFDRILAFGWSRLLAPDDRGLDP